MIRLVSAGLRMLKNGNIEGTFSCNITVFNELTSLRQKPDGLQHALGIDSRFIVFHFSIDDVDYTSSSSPDGSCSSVQSVNISFL